MIVLGREPRGEVVRQPDLGQLEWAAMDDPYRLFEHAITKIPHRHTYLVLAELVDAALPHWTRCYPEDPRPGQCAVDLREWCFGRASRPQLRAARDAAFEASGRRVSDRCRKGAPSASFMAASEVAYAAAAALAHADRSAPRETRVSQAIAVLYRVVRAEIEWNPDVRAKRDVELKSLYGPWKKGEGFPIVDAQAVRRAREQAEAVNCKQPYADLLRTLIPYPWRHSSRWHRAGSRVYAGDAILILRDDRLVRAEPHVGGPQIPPGARN